MSADHRNKDADGSPNGMDLEAQKGQISQVRWLVDQIVKGELLSSSSRRAQDSWTDRVCRLLRCYIWRLHMLGISRSDRRWQWQGQ
jgi:hypothetical protein